MTRSSQSLALAALFSASFLVGGSALASPPGGTLYITDHQVDTHKESWEKDLKKANKAAILKEGDNWHVFFVAYLKKAPGAPDLYLVFTDVSGGKREEINNFPINTQPTAKIVMSDVSFNTETGIKPGKYDVELMSSKKEVYAKARLELK